MSQNVGAGQEAEEREPCGRQAKLVQGPIVDQHGGGEGPGEVEETAPDVPVLKVGVRCDELNAEGGGIGEACQNARQCALPASEAICATEYPGGMCTTQCTSDCPVVAGKGEGYCADFRSTGICLAVCNPNAPTCRKGYTCTRVARFGAPKESQYTCYPEL